MSIGRTFKAVTPSDSVNLPLVRGNPPAALRFGSAGSVVLVGLDGEQVTLTGVTAGEQWPCSTKQVLDSGTDVTGIVAIYL